MQENTVPVSQALNRLSVPHRLFQHPGPVDSLEQAARERGQSPDQVVRSIVFRLSADEFVMVLVAGPQQVDWRALRRYFGKTRLTTATKEEILKATGYPLGAVAPFGLPEPMRILVDESVLSQDEISLGSGVRGITVILSVQDLMSALGNVEVIRVT